MSVRKISWSWDSKKYGNALFHKHCFIIISLLFSTRLHCIVDDLSSPIKGASSPIEDPSSNHRGSFILPIKDPSFYHQGSLILPYGSFILPSRILPHTIKDPSAYQRILHHTLKDPSAYQRILHIPLKDPLSYSRFERIFSNKSTH